MLAISADNFRVRCSTVSARWTGTFAPAPFESNLPVLMALLVVWVH